MHHVCVCAVDDLRPLFCTCAAQADTDDHLARMDLTVYGVHLTSAHGRFPLGINHGDPWQPNPAGGDSWSYPHDLLLRHTAGPTCPMSPFSPAL